MSEYLYVNVPFAEHDIPWVGMEDPSSAHPEGYPVFVHINWIEVRDFRSTRSFSKRSLPEFMKKGKRICVPYYQSEDGSSAVRISLMCLPESVYHFLLQEHYPTMKWMLDRAEENFSAYEILQEQMKFKNIQ